MNRAKRLFCIALRVSLYHLKGGLAKRLMTPAQCPNSSGSTPKSRPGQCPAFRTVPLRHRTGPMQYRAQCRSSKKFPKKEPGLTLSPQKDQADGFK